MQPPVETQQTDEPSPEVLSPLSDSQNSDPSQRYSPVIPQLCPSEKGDKSGDEQTHGGVGGDDDDYVWGARIDCDDDEGEDYCRGVLDEGDYEGGGYDGVDADSLLQCQQGGSPRG